MLKQILSFLLRKLNLIESFDYIRFLISRYKNSNDNKIFLSEFPDVKLPSDFVLYESFGALSYRRYYVNGKASAESFIQLLRKHATLENKNILEWGCGPARTIRHFPDLLKDSNNKFFGSDYNKQSIAWNKENIANVQFTTNQLNPPLPFESNFFDVVYSVSVFTHLSETLHYEWFNELMRITKPGGLLMFTTHGDAFKEKLLYNEKKIYDTRGIVIRKTSSEGKRTYTAFQSPAFINKLIGNNKVLEHVTNRNSSNKFSQDLWLVQKI